DLDLTARIVPLQDDVDDPLVRPIAELLRALGCEHFGLLDGLWRIGAEFAEARDAYAVDEDHREAAAAPAAAAGRGAERLDQVGNGTRAVRGNVGFAQLEHRRRRRVDRAAQAGGGNHDLFLGSGRGFVTGIRLNGFWRRCALRERR